MSVYRTDPRIGRRHVWVPAHMGSALDLCANECGVRRMLETIFISGEIVDPDGPNRNDLRVFSYDVDPGCVTVDVHAMLAPHP